MKRTRHLANGFILTALAAAFFLFSSCRPAVGYALPPGVKDQAAAEATSMIQNAEATVIVLQAQGRATAMIQQAVLPTSMPQPAAAANPEAVSTTVHDAQAPGLPSSAEGTPEANDASSVRLLGVSLGTDTGLILVQFKAPPSVARNWQQGNVYIIDEATGVIYNEIPVAPVIGPLFARPKVSGQAGYVMFVNTNSSLRQGALVTVILGEFRQEHQPVA